VQNLVVVSHTKCAQVGGPKHSGDDGALPPWEGDVADTLESPDSPICVITPNFVTLCQTIWA